jgi:methylisocitrate lyase
MILYPLSAHRAMMKSAEIVFKTIIEEGSQKSCTQIMQTRDELYNYLDYHRYEKQLDELNKKN